MIVLKIIGWVLLGLLALIIAVLCIKVVVSVEYSEKRTEVFVKWLFLKIPLYPAKKKDGKKETAAEGGDEAQAPPEEAQKEDSPSETSAEEKTEDASEEETTTDEEGKTEEKPAEAAKKQSSAELLKLLYEAEGIDGLIEIVKRVFSYLGTFFGGLFRAFIIEDFQLDVCCAKKDAAATAIYYGEVSAALFPMLGAIASGCTMKNYDINIYPDFLARYSEASFYLRLHVVPVRLVGITLALVFKLLFKVLVGLVIKISRTKNGSPEVQQNKKSNTKNNNKTKE